jgi:ketosteroid isomerase-like protein
MSESNKKVVLTFIDAMGRGDAQAAAPCITEDCFTLAKGFGKFAGVRTRETILATIAAFRKLMPAGMEPTIVSATAEADRVVVEFEGNGVLFNGQSYCNQYCMVFTLFEGRIKQVNEYFCTILADEVLFPLVAEQGL